MSKDKRTINQLKKQILWYADINDTLYRRSYDPLWLKCVLNPKAKLIMKEIHSRLCGAHQFGPKIKLKIKHMEYYWPSMVADYENYAKKCHICQIHEHFIHQTSNTLHLIMISWSCSMWGTNVVGLIDHPTSRGHRFILAATNYFTRWAEDIPLKEVKTSYIVKFFKRHILCQFGTPQKIIFNNGTTFKSS
jgi:Integrase zinc binding domain